MDEVSHGLGRVVLSLSYMLCYRWLVVYAIGIWRFSADVLLGGIGGIVALWEEKAYVSVVESVVLEELL